MKKDLFALILAIFGLALVVYILYATVPTASHQGPLKTGTGERIYSDTTYTGEMTENNQNHSSYVNRVEKPDGLIMEDEEIGTGKEVKSGDTVIINYKGTLQDGTKFDSSYDRGEPLEIQIGVGQVIQGWDEGVIGMKIGGKRHLTIPSELGYGAAGKGTIPPNATLIFDVELLGIK